MSDQQPESSNREKVDEALDKAKQGAKKLAGWLGAKLHQAADMARETPILRDQMEKVDDLLEQRAEAARERELEDIYLDEDARIAKLAQTFADRDAELEQAKAALDDNVSILRNRGVKESDSEMTDYKAQITELRARRDDLYVLQNALRGERSRVQRRLASARASLTAGTSLEALKASAREHVDEVAQRVEQVLSTGRPIE